MSIIKSSKNARYLHLYPGFLMVELLIAFVVCLTLSVVVVRYFGAIQDAYRHARIQLKAANQAQQSLYCQEAAEGVQVDTWAMPTLPGNLVHDYSQEFVRHLVFVSASLTITEGNKPARMVRLVGARHVT